MARARIQVGMLASDSYTPIRVRVRVRVRVRTIC